MKSQPLSSELREVLSVLTESPTRYHRGAVLTIIASLRNVEVNNFVALRYLRAWAKEKRERVEFLRDADPLRVLRDEILQYPVSPYVAKRVLREVVAMGWYESAEYIAGRFFKRSLTSDEVRTLIQAYINDRASRSSHDERRLMEFARKYMSKEDADACEALIEQFVRDFEQAD